ncbi:dTMP kinase [Zhihengliuella salsuginis]|uniref:Thymidylate kinase n=1 Tax=Zhihengliuella salsuginis TaxID=578222 RepID=A0ABQ3GCD9_9MICC|nr:thymidylate kinase [Zhihengliuella salsuginis]GHD00255.1 thymidylate kinase [Zhihengliuella salsuginis]
MLLTRPQPAIAPSVPSAAADAVPAPAASQARRATVAVVGIDGSGKTTAASYLAASLDDAGTSAQLLRNPSGRSWLGRWSAKSGYAVPATLAETFETVLRGLNVIRSHTRARAFAGLTVMDRHLVCQEVTRETRGLDPNGLLARGLRQLRRNLREPELTVLLDVSPATALGRIRERGLDTESLDYLEAARDAYLACAVTEGWAVIDAEADAFTVVSRLREIVRERIVDPQPAR